MEDERFRALPFGGWRPEYSRSRLVLGGGICCCEGGWEADAGVLLPDSAPLASIVAAWADRPLGLGRTEPSIGRGAFVCDSLQGQANVRRPTMKLRSFDPAAYVACRSIGQGLEEGAGPMDCWMYREAERRGVEETQKRGLPRRRKNQRENCFTKSWWSRCSMLGWWWFRRTLPRRGAGGPPASAVCEWCLVGRGHERATTDKLLQ